MPIQLTGSLDISGSILLNGTAVTASGGGGSVPASVEIGGNIMYQYAAGFANPTYTYDVSSGAIVDVHISQSGVYLISGSFSSTQSGSVNLYYYPDELAVGDNAAVYFTFLGATSGSGDTRVTIFAGGISEAENAKLILFGNNNHQMSGSLDISGSLIVGGTITAQTLIVQTITSSVEFITGSTIFGSQLSNTHQFTGSVGITGSLNAPIITGSLFGTASWAQNAVTASYIAAANVAGLSLFQITTGSITASVGLGANDLFLIKSGSTTYFNISSSGDTTINTNKFVVRNLTTQQPVLTISQSVVQFATQSADPIGSADIGGIIFTSTAMYIGLN
jgi:hypothetical protein